LTAFGRERAGEGHRFVIDRHELEEHPPGVAPAFGIVFVAAAVAAGRHRAVAIAGIS
jgi:hypothetical protein